MPTVFSEFEFVAWSVHKTDPAEPQNNIYAETPQVPADNETADLMVTYFNKGLNTFYSYNFREEDTEPALLFRNAFDNPENFHRISLQLARSFAQNALDNTTAGYFFAIYYNRLLFEGEPVSAIGIYRAESKDAFWTPEFSEGKMAPLIQDGFLLNKVDKAALIIDMGNTPMKIFVGDRHHKDNPALYWTKQFLQLIPEKNNHAATRNIIDLCNSFVDNVFNEENSIAKPDQILFKEKAENYLTTAETFDKRGFEHHVLDNNPEIVQAFEEYKTEYGNRQDMYLADEFDISEGVLSKEQKKFKSVFKLDKRFSLYVHGGHKFMERGFDDTRDMHFYKIYFKEEK